MNSVQVFAVMCPLYDGYTDSLYNLVLQMLTHCQACLFRKDSYVARILCCQMYGALQMVNNA